MVKALNLETAKSREWEKKRLTFFQMNEINFDAVQYYINRGELPNFADIISRSPLIPTTAIGSYHDIEPWITWLTIYSGLDHDHHNVFRLGDKIDSSHSLVWEVLEDFDRSVCVIAPMNAPNRLNDRSNNLFLSDPWSNEESTAKFGFPIIAESFSNLINNNASNRVRVKDIAVLGKFFIFNMPFSFKAKVCHSFVKVLMGKKWHKAIIADYFFASLCFRYGLSKNYSSTFLNAGAHIQHHYFKCSSFVSSGSGSRNDPLLDVFKAYDFVLGQFIAFSRNASEHELLIATAHSQEPYPVECNYWRVCDYGALASLLEIEQIDYEGRMSRDFVLKSDQKLLLDLWQKVLEQLLINGEPIFTVDLRSDSLFVTLEFSGAHQDFAQVCFKDRTIDLTKVIVWVAEKNGHHVPYGWLWTSFDSMSASSPGPIEIKQIESIILEFFEISSSQRCREGNL